MVQDLQRMYPGVTKYLKNLKPEPYDLLEVQDAFAWLYKITNAKVQREHIGRMQRLNFLVWKNDGSKNGQFFLGTGPPKSEDE